MCGACNLITSYATHHRLRRHRHLTRARRRVLQAVVGCDEYQQYVERLRSQHEKNEATDIKGIIADTSSPFFSNITWALNTLAPFHSAIKEVEGDTAKLSDGYYATLMLSQHVAAIAKDEASYMRMLLDDSLPGETLVLGNSFSRTFQSEWTEREKQASSAAAAAAAMLDPRYKDKVKDMPAAHKQSATDFITHLAKAQCGSDGGSRVQAQLIMYLQQPGNIGVTPELLDTVRHGVSPEGFWQHLGELGHAFELSQIAHKLLTIPPSSASSERLFSAVGRLWDASRCRLKDHRVRKLLFIYFNRRALLRDGAARSADDFDAFVEWLASIPDATPSPPAAAAATSGAPAAGADVIEVE